MPTILTSIKDDDPFESPRLVINHARNYTKKVAAEIGVFFGSNPCSMVVTYDPQTLQDVYAIQLNRSIPPTIAPKVADVVSNLRKALDQSVYASAVYIGGGSPQNTGFPFANDEAGVKGELEGPRLSGNPPEIRPLLAAFNPHKCGNKLLWCLNRIRNPDIHRLLVPVAHALAEHAMFTGDLMVHSNKAGMWLGTRWVTLENKIEFARLPRGTNFNPKGYFSFQITFGDVEVVGGQEIIGTLEGFASEVEGVFLAIEGETRRIGRIP